MPISGENVRKLCPKLKAEAAEELAAALNTHLETGGLNSALRRSHFFAQCAHESAGFSRLEENLNYSAERLRTVFPSRFKDDATAQQYAHQPEKIANRVYAGKIGNGDEASGDGWRYRGRGIIQLTGRENYRKVGARIGIDLENDPDQASKPDVAVRAAIAYWNDRKLSDAADRDDIDAVTAGINPKKLGLDERRRYLQSARAIWP